MGARRALVVAALVLAGCGGGDERETIPQPSSPDTINFSTPDFKDGEAIPAELTCDGAGRAPTIVWRAIPPETIELVMVVDDPDAPDGTFTHWTVYGLTGATGSGLAPEGKFPAGVLNGKNSAGKDGLDAALPARGRASVRLHDVRAGRAPAGSRPARSRTRSTKPSRARSPTAASPAPTSAARPTRRVYSRSW